jgi:hypothetical protein
MSFWGDGDEVSLERSLHRWLNDTVEVCGSSPHGPTIIPSGSKIRFSSDPVQKLTSKKAV